MKTTTWALRLIEPGVAPCVWPLAVTPLRVGRGLSCQVHFDDARVSRLQCELWLEGSLPRIRNHSRGNPTEVNGVVFEEAGLALGDVISFAQYHLVLDQLHLPPRDMPENVAGLTTRSFRDTPYRPQTPAALAQSRGKDLLALFTFSKAIAEKTSVDALVDFVREHVQTQLRARAVWLAWPIRDAHDITFHPPQTPGGGQEPPHAFVRETFLLAKGILKEQGDPVVAVPLQEKTRVIGVICAHARRGRAFVAADLEYLLAVGESLTPRLLAIERMEQHERDAQYLSQASLPQTLLGGSRAMAVLRENIAHAARTRGHVLLLGESGTGKELVARMIHEMSNRAGGPYVAVNCAALPAELFESEMFGHERGAFTGANQRRKGLFEEAHGGTLFLDEMGDLSLPSQARLLRAAEGGLIRRVGGTGEMRVDIRLISATNRSLPDVSNARFRMDLYHRLAGFVVQLPPLRDRRVDIPELARHFLRLCSPETPARPATFSDAALAQLRAYDWPGNVRELRNIVERACYLATGDQVEQVDFLVATQFPVPRDGTSETASLEDVEARHLRSVLESNGGDVAATAKALGLARSTLYYKLSKFNIRLRSRNWE